MISLRCLVLNIVQIGFFKLPLRQIKYSGKTISNQIKYSAEWSVDMMIAEKLFLVIASVVVRQLPIKLNIVVRYHL